MEKVLVEVFLPAANTSYDIYIPLASKMSEVLFLISSALSDLAEGKFKPSDDTVLCDAVSGKTFDINTTVSDSGIKNGSKLMLI
jgi:hypothetical protein